MKSEDSKPVAASMALLNPSSNVARICCVGHGTWTKADGQFLVPRNVTVRFRVPHDTRTFGDNDMFVRPDEDRSFGKLCHNNRLWPLTGDETTQLPKATTQDARWFIKSWHCQPGTTTWLYVDEIGESVRLCDIVYGLGGAASLNSGRNWEVVWLACREVVASNDAEVVKQKTHTKHGVTLG